MRYTEKLGLRLPEGADKFDIEEFNENFATLDNSLVPGENGFVTDGEPIYLWADTDQYHSYTAGMDSEGELDLTVGVKRGSRYDPYKAAQTHYYYDEEEAVGVAETAADIVRLRAGESVLEVTEEGVTFNGKPLGGGSQPIGQLVGILSGVTDSVIGTLEEVTE
ncbi:MAG: hypothetical protein IJ645_00065 [Ruminococcus sp.]|nr:hypothetical protein [Ruminococcus sp.]